MCKCEPITDRPVDENGDATIDMERVQETLKTIDKDNSFKFIMEYEDGTLCPECIVALFQYLINTGMAWSLQGSYGRFATSLIQAGYCHKA